MTEQTAKRPPFKVNGVASLKHLNVRKEGPEDNKVLAVDLKLEFKGIDYRLCDYFDEALAEFLWRHETAGMIVRNAYLEPVAYFNEISGAQVKVEGDSFVGCEVKKFSVRPRDGGVIDLGCQVSIYPSASDVSNLAKSVQDGVRVEIEGPPDLFDFVAPPPAAPAQQLAVESTADDTDALLPQARDLVINSKRASISLVQRHLRIGYNRAARLLEALEKMGVISAMSPTGDRTVLITA